MPRCNLDLHQWLSFPHSASLHLLRCVSVSECGEHNCEVCLSQLDL